MFSRIESAFLIVGRYLAIVFGAGGSIIPIESSISWIFSADINGFSSWIFLIKSMMILGIGGLPTFLDFPPQWTLNTVLLQRITVSGLNITERGFLAKISGVLYLIAAILHYINGQMSLFILSVVLSIVTIRLSMYMSYRQVRPQLKEYKESVWQMEADGASDDEVLEFMDQEI